ncbi:hypothetical protein D3C80_1909420 [compost metagenome]
MGDAGIGQQEAFDLTNPDRRILSAGGNGGLAAHHGGELAHALAISAVVEHQQMAVARDDGGHGRLHAEGAAALQRHHHMGVLRVQDIEQIMPHAGGDGVEIGIP